MTPEAQANWLEVGNKKVTYKELYDLGLVSYGLTALID